jgi:hypothetical protein
MVVCVAAINVDNTDKVWSMIMQRRASRSAQRDSVVISEHRRAIRVPQNRSEALLVPRYEWEANETGSNYTNPEGD